MQTRDLLHAPAGRNPGNLRLGPNHGYAFNGDQVQINAEILGQPTDGQQLALQLWACDAPLENRPVRGTKVAEIALGAGQTRIDAAIPAFPPAGQTAHSMVFALADSASGRLLDHANFPRWERFTLPHIAGSAGFALDGDKVRLTADRVVNPRPDDNLSGTLSLELWALPRPYAERGLDGGRHLAGVDLGCLAGQQDWGPLVLDLAVGAHPAGTWHITLLLREWTAAGYATRDFTDFPIPVTWDAERVAAPAEPPPTPAPATRAAPAKPARKASADTAGKVSVNTASETELAAVKSLPKAVAAAIVAARPFKQLDDLLAVKGIGEKTLDKLKASLKL